MTVPSRTAATAAESYGVQDQVVRGTSLIASSGQSLEKETPWSGPRRAPTLARAAGAQYSPRMAAPTSLEGLRSCIRKLIMLSDLMSRLHPRKKTPKTTVSDSTQSTAICATRDTHRLRSSGASPAGTPSLAVSGAPPGQQSSHVPSPWLRFPRVVRASPPTSSRPLWFRKLTFIPARCLGGLNTRARTRPELAASALSGTPWGPWITLAPAGEEGGRPPTRWRFRSAYLPTGKPAAWSREQQAAHDLERANSAWQSPTELLVCRAAPPLATAELRPAPPFPNPLAAPKLRGHEPLPACSLRKLRWKGSERPGSTSPRAK